MALLTAYHRPHSLLEAIRLLQADNQLVPLAGGTQLIAQLELRQLPAVTGVVDLGRLELDQLAVADDLLTLGATATLTDVCSHPVAGALAGGLLRQAARGEGPINLRNRATVGGTVAVNAPDSEWTAALLALDARLLLSDGTIEQVVRLEEFTGVPHGWLITAVQLPRTAHAGGLARIARTPSDRPIVAALAALFPSGPRVALCGLGPRPLLQGVPFSPRDDFKASAAYRQTMAPILIRRAVAAASRTSP